MTPTAHTWADDRMVAVDFESTGTDPETARIVAAAVVAVGGGDPAVAGSWTVDPGIDIPAEAAAIHGITTERAKAEGCTPYAAVRDIVNAIDEFTESGAALVTFKAPYTLTMLLRECTRQGIKPPQRLHPVIDPSVLDKHVDAFRRGKRTLAALCRHYQVQQGEAHEPSADALAAARLAWRLAHTYPDIGARELQELHALQIRWADEQADGLRRYLRRSDPTAQVDGRWPVIPTRK
ncbi:3'-5' exonuclease [Streptomyces sp. A7024]|uniref:3'-5' exonuclease n=1 Tax=Streptomyces coryli TaxID=1128680 RepID=A0A6G4TV74_9ACTN|nr:exonuclease domain-containing protein [Streptomyces coryli]NGN63885.1 3'-5' exonuclease [Streptomyces coryli]